MATTTDDPWAATLEVFREAVRPHGDDLERMAASYSGIQVDPGVVAALETWTGDHPARGANAMREQPSPQVDDDDQGANAVDTLLSYVHSLIGTDQESWYALGLMLERRIGAMNAAERKLLSLWHAAGEHRGWL